MEALEGERRALLLSWFPRKQEGKKCESSTRTCDITLSQGDVDDTTDGKIWGLLLEEIEASLSSGDWDGLQACYKVIKQCISGDCGSCPFDVMLCALKLLDACVVIGRSQIRKGGIRDSVVVGSLLAAGICLSSCASDEHLSSRVRAEGRLEHTLEGFHATMKLFDEASRMPSEWEQYGLTLFKSMSKTALGFLTHGMEEECFRICDGVIVPLAACCPGIVPKALKALSAMSQHVSGKATWLCLLTRAMEFGSFSINDFSSSDISIIEISLSCSRRMLLAMVESGDPIWTHFDAGEKLCVYIRMLSSIDFLYATSGCEDLHSGLVAMGIISRDICSADYQSQDLTCFCKALCNTLVTLLGMQADLDNVPSIERREQCEAENNIKDLEWLSRTLLKSGAAALNIPDVLKYSVLWASIMCSLMALSCSHGEKKTMSKLIIQGVSHLSQVSRPCEVMEGLDFYMILRKVACCFWDMGLLDNLSRLFDNLAKATYPTTEDFVFSPSEFASSFLPVVKKKRVSTELWLQVLKYSIASTGTRAEAYPLISSQHEAEVKSILDLAQTYFNPAKTPDAFVDFLLECHRHSSIFPDLFSVEQFMVDLQSILDVTKTKIGHKRIGEIQSIINILRVEDSVGMLLRESHEYHQKVTKQRKDMLKRDPSVIHSEGWAYSDLEKQIRNMLKLQGSWNNIISEALEAIQKMRHVSTLSCSTSIIGQLEVLVNLHRPGTLASGGPCLFWEGIAHPYVEDNFNFTKQMEGFIAESAYLDDARKLFKFHMKMSKNQAMRGHIHSALFHAIEWHKGTSTIFNCLESAALGDNTDTCWWGSVSEHLSCCSWLGFLFSVSGLYDESVQAYNEGLRLGCLIGSPPVCLYFTVCLGEVHMLGGDNAKFQAMVNQAVAIENSLDCVDERTSPLECILAHLQILRARLDRKTLEFGKAKSRISASRRLLSDIDSGLWYRVRVLAVSALEDMLILLDEESSVPQRNIQVSIRTVLECWTYDTLMLGAPLSCLFVLQAQALVHSSLDQCHSNEPYVWVSKSSQGRQKNQTLIESLWRISWEIKCSPFCQKVVFQLLAPLFASAGCKYAAVLLLHASSNPTLQFQQNLVMYSKKALSALRMRTIEQLSEGCDLGAFHHQLYSNSSSKMDLEDFERKAEMMVSSWMEKVGTLVICGVAVYNSSVYGPSTLMNDRFVIFRLRKDQVPIMVEIPSPETQSSHPIHLLHGTKACGAVELLESKLQDILKKSNSNMRSISPGSSEADQRLWWQERIDLDHEMQELLKELQLEWIGPWKCLFMDVDHGEEVVQDEVKLLTALSSHERARLSKGDLETLSRTLNVARHGRSNVDKYGEIRLSNSFDALHLGECSTPKAVVNRKVSFKSPCKGDLSDQLHCSPEMISVVRGEQVDDISQDFASFNFSETEERNDSNALSQARSVARRKHKSRLPQMHSFMTPKPRKALQSHNFNKEVFQTPKTSIQQSRNVSVTPLLDKTKTMPPMQRCRPEKEDIQDRHTVALVLDQAIQSLPWESSFRMVSETRWEFYRLPSLPVFVETVPRKKTISVDSCYYAINPSGDLVSTQKTFEEWFRGIKGWRGRVGSPPNANELSKALQEHDLFVYCGHGGGEQYLPLSRLRSLNSCASSLLMGCSSGRLKWNNRGAYEASGVILAYMLAGCPAVVGNLWDVTDKDIDRYCQELISKILSSTSHDGQTSIGHIVQNSRHACKLPFLIGAAPVCYGIPATFTLQSYGMHELRRDVNNNTYHIS